MLWRCQRHLDTKTAWIAACYYSEVFFDCYSTSDRLSIERQLAHERKGAVLTTASLGKCIEQKSCRKLLI